MIWVYEILLNIWFGYSVITYLVGSSLNPLHRVFAGAPIGIFTFTWLVFISTSRVKLNFFSTIPAIIIQIIVSSYLSTRNYKKYPIKYLKIDKIQLYTYIMGVLFLTFIFNYSLLRNGYEVKGAAYGDLPFHLNIISSAAYGFNNKRNSLFDFRSTFYENVSLVYPYITNYYSSILIASGRASLRSSIYIPSIVVVYSLIISLYHLSYMFSQNHYVCMISVFMFFTLGGHGWISIFRDDKSTYSDYIHQWGESQFEYWFHSIFHVIVPQRSSLWSMPLCYWSLVFIIYGIKYKSYSSMLIAGIYVGFMPLVQVHSYMAIAQWSIIYCLIKFPFKKRQKWVNFIKLWSVFAVIANLMAIPQLLTYLQRITNAKRGNFLSPNPIFMSKWSKFKLLSPFILWWRGLGFFAYISLFAGLFILTRKQIKLYLPSFIVWMIANIIRYQPWELDNTKIFYAAWIPIALPVYGNFIMRLARIKGGSFLSVTILIVSSLASLLYTFVCLTSYVPLYSMQHLNFGDFLLECTDKDAIFLTDGTHNSPVNSLAGKCSWHGYEGWLGSHGYNDDSHYKDLKKMRNSPKSIDIFMKHNITYYVSYNNKDFQDFIDEKKYWKLVYWSKDSKTRVFKRIS